MKVKEPTGRASGSSSRPQARRLFHRRSTPYIVATDVASLLVAFGFGAGLESWVLLTVGLSVSFFVAAGLHRPRLSLSALDDGPPLAAGTLAAFVVAIFVTGHSFAADDVGVALVAVLAVIGGRAMAYGVVRSSRRRGLVAHRTLVVGAGLTGLELTELLLDHPEYGLEPVGYFDPAPVPDIAHPVPVVNESRSMVDAVAEADAEVVIVAFSSIPERDLVDVIRACDRIRAEIFVIPRLFELFHPGGGREMDNIWGIPVIRLRRGSHRSPAWRFKRAFDLGIVSAISVILLPLIVAVAVTVRFAIGPGVLFRQERVGLDGRRFEILKFRTMNPEDGHDPATTWATERAHLTRAGVFLRRFSLDELPQLWNVFRGDMSLVGPRPERPHFVGAFTDAHPAYHHRHRVPSGMTGLAQVKGLRGDTSIECRARFDNAYIDGWSVLTDLKLLALTVASVLRHGGRR